MFGIHLYNICAKIVTPTGTIIANEIKLWHGYSSVTLATIPISIIIIYEFIKSSLSIVFLRAIFVGEDKKLFMLVIHHS